MIVVAGKTLPLVNVFHSISYEFSAVSYGLLCIWLYVEHGFWMAVNER